MNSSIAPSPHKLCHLMFLDIFGPCPQPRAQERLRAPGLGLNMPDQRPRPRLEGPTSLAQRHMQTSLSSCCPDCPWEGAAWSPQLAVTSWCLPEGAGSVSHDHEMRRKISTRPAPPSVGTSLSGRMSETRQLFTGCYSGRARQGEGLGTLGPAEPARSGRHET